MAIFTKLYIHVYIIYIFVTSFHIFNESSLIIYRDAQYLDTQVVVVVVVIVPNTLG